MTAVKARKKPAKISKVSKSAKKPARKALKAKAASARARTRNRKPKQLPVRKDETTIKLGPHSVDRHPVVGGIQVRPAPRTRPMVPATQLHHVTARHH